MNVNIKMRVVILLEKGDDCLQTVFFFLSSSGFYRRRLADRHICVYSSSAPSTQSKRGIYPSEGILKFEESKLG